MYWLIPNFYPIAIGWMPLTDTTDNRTNRQSDKRTNGSVRLSFRWSLTLIGENSDLLPLASVWCGRSVVKSTIQLAYIDIISYRKVSTLSW